MQVIGEASDGLEAVQKAQQLQPDLILLDIGLPSLNGIEAALRIKEVSPGSRILFVSENSSQEIVERALSTGAGGYIIKSDAAGELLPAVEAVLKGAHFVSPSLSVQVVPQDASASPSEHRMGENEYSPMGQRRSIGEFLKSVIDATAADFGNIQLYDPKNSTLRIVAHHGFEDEFLTFFATVHVAHGCACSRAMNERSRIVVKDVATDPLFSDESRGVLLRANVRSLQTTPLVGSSGTLLGMISTHHRQPAAPTIEALKQVDNLTASFLAAANA